MTKTSRVRWAIAALTAGLMLGTVMVTEAAPGRVIASRVSDITVNGTQPVGIFDGVPYVRTYGWIWGVIGEGDDVVGFADLPKNAQGSYEYAAEFEIIAPAPGQPQNEVVFVDAENRGNAVMLNLVNEAGVSGPPSRARYPEGVGNGFFQRHKTSYARVQWQTGIVKAVPESAQGVGLVIMRDFARMLAGYTGAASAGGYRPASYGKLILGGKSQSSWMVNAFIAEGFNVEPISGKAIFQGAISVDGIGHWMALNNLAAANNVAQRPYIAPDTKPLQRAEMLSRPTTDPVFVDVAAYTDFYRLRAGLTSVATTTPKYRRYDIPGPHSIQKPPSTVDEFADCNNGEAVPLNPVVMSPYIRAQIVGIEKAIGVRAAQEGPSLPPSSVFRLGPAPRGTANFNPLEGVDVKVPLTDANGWPQGGVRFPDAEHPLGKPTPVSLPPVITTSIDDTCGNRGQFQPFTTAELTKRYGSKEKYLELYGESLAKLIAQGFVLQEDELAMLGYASYLWDNAESYVDRSLSAAAQ
jgi:hypothetical protein